MTPIAPKSRVHCHKGSRKHKGPFLVGPPMYLKEPRILQRGHHSSIALTYCPKKPSLNIGLHLSQQNLHHGGKGSQTKICLNPCVGFSQKIHTGNPETCQNATTIGQREFKALSPSELLLAAHPSRTRGSQNSPQKWSVYRFGFT